MRNKKILVISGGDSSERKISLLSSKQIVKILTEIGYQAQLFDLRKGLAALEKILPNFNVAFPVLHGEEGEGGSLQKFLQDSRIPYVGGDPEGFKQGWYKIAFKEYCDKKNILTAPWERVKTKSDIIKFGFPSVLKSDNGGSSREVIILKSKSDINKYQVKKLLSSKDSLMVERFLPGIEVTVSILKNNVLPIIEIIPPEGKWFDYKNKYSGVTQEIPFAPSISQDKQRELAKIGLKIHQDLQLGSLSRIDFIVSDGKPYALEVNTIPGLTEQSLFPKAAQAAGISFNQLVESLVQDAYSSLV